MNLDHSEQPERDMNMALSMLVFFFFACIFTSLVHCDTNPDHASALHVMYVSLKSPNQLTKWSSRGGDPCGESWLGVTCSGPSVTEIVLSGLGLTGSLGYQLTSLASVINLDVSNNNLGNELPYQLPPNMERLNLAGNAFNGSVPYSISMMPTLQYLNISHNQFSYQLNDMFKSLVNLSTLDLSFNHFPGILPSSFSSLSNVTTMFLQNNNFTGTIDVLADLPLEHLNVANNNFTGWIPLRLQNIDLQKEGNSWSSGPAPSPPPPPPGGTPPVRPTPETPQSGNNTYVPTDDSGGDHHGKKSGMAGGGIAGILVTFFVVGAIVAFFLLKRRSRTSSLVDEEKLDHQPFAPFVVSDKVQGDLKSLKSSSALRAMSFHAKSFRAKSFRSPASMNLRPPPLDRHKSYLDEDSVKKPIVAKKVYKVPIDATSYSIADLQIATKSFSSETLIGEGSFGRVYRATFDNGKVFAVKKIYMSSLPESEEFVEIVTNMSRLDHPNITKLVGYCSEHGQHLLVHVYHKNGSLHDFLHLPDDSNKPLTWSNRVKIALGTARALEYLHESCSPSVVHKNFKSANIILSRELNPFLSDCGLEKFIPNAADQNAGSGYSPPEVTQCGQYTMKSDIYSFGVVMLELLTGRRPFDSSKARNEQSLVGWATPQLHDIDALAKMVDPSLEGLYPVQSLSRFADVIALCVQSEPEFRPPMSEVVQALVRLVQRAKTSKKTTTGSDLMASQQG